MIDLGYTYLNLGSQFVFKLFFILKYIKLLLFLDFFYNINTKNKKYIKNIYYNIFLIKKHNNHNINTHLTTKGKSSRSIRDDVQSTYIFLSVDT
jgi:hypothetical protein